MTTIAYKDGIIAYDSRATSGDRIACDNANKRRSSKGVEFFFCGNFSDIEHLIKAYFERVPVDKTADVCSFIVSDGKVFKGGVDRGAFWIHEAHEIDAIGSGTAYALTAMDCGLSAREAIKMAIKRDPGTGGKVRTFKIKP